MNELTCQVLHSIFLRIFLFASKKNLFSPFLIRDFYCQNSVSFLKKKIDCVAFLLLLLLLLLYCLLLQQTVWWCAHQIFFCTKCLSCFSNSHLIEQCCCLDWFCFVWSRIISIQLYVFVCACNFLYRTVSFLWFARFKNEWASVSSFFWLLNIAFYSFVYELIYDFFFRKYVCLFSRFIIGINIIHNLILLFLSLYVTVLIIFSLFLFFFVLICVSFRFFLCLCL